MATTRTSKVQIKGTEEHETKRIGDAIRTAAEKRFRGAADAVRVQFRGAWEAIVDFGADGGTREYSVVPASDGAGFFFVPADVSLGGVITHLEA